jgi:hypothetical protein
VWVISPSSPKSGITVSGAGFTATEAALVDGVEEADTAGEEEESVEEEGEEEECAGEAEEAVTGFAEATTVEGRAVLASDESLALVSMSGGRSVSSVIADATEEVGSAAACAGVSSCARV